MEAKVVDLSAVVRWMGLSRYIIGVVLLLCGVWEWWSAAALLLVAGFLADAYDGSLARWAGVVRVYGQDFDHRTSLVMVASGLVSAVIGGVLWPPCALGIGVGYLVWQELRWYLGDGGARDAVVLLGVIAYPTLVLVLGAIFAVQGFGWLAPHAVGAFLILFVVVGTTKRGYIKRRYDDIANGRD